MNVIEMLQMYLEDHGVHCHLPPKMHRYDSDGGKILNVSLKYTNITSNIVVTIGHLEFEINGTTIIGKPPGRRYESDKQYFKVDLSKPDAFEEVLEWIRAHEAKIQSSTGFEHAIAEYMAIGEPGYIEAKDITKAIFEDFRNNAGKGLFKQE